VRIFCLPATNSQTRNRWTQRSHNQDIVNSEQCELWQMLNILMMNSFFSETKTCTLAVAHTRTESRKRCMTIGTPCLGFWYKLKTRTSDFNIDCPWLKSKSYIGCKLESPWPPHAKLIMITELLRKQPLHTNWYILKKLSSLQTNNWYKLDRSYFPRWLFRVFSYQL